MSNPVPGWYPDPTGDFRERWWDGAAWSTTVRTGHHQTEAGFEDVPVPANESELWRGGRQVLTTHAAYLPDGRQVVTVPWWAVADVTVRGGWGATGAVVLRINYPGYTDRAERPITGCPDPHALAATCFTWSRRHRRAAGYS
ncbi:DUF2510 domain-containing protein [Nocardioides panacisoli]|uniref:DUF2510 domain-containing protein n=1 Tax=Nocardioides panacisoli TaxID=627624 RepID=UPI001C631935|nr:DUF2510 domain-containing protein [Nocardioides panacisoli]QYJ02720.1 DUF2510 domain-containing protein [Nocardioides panacisoli]